MAEKLKGKYGFSVAFSMVVGIVIGIGIFFKAAPVIVASGMNPKITVAAWIAAGVISILSGLTAAEIGAAVPEKGGIIAWIRRVYGDKVAYMVGWAQAVIYCPAIVAILAYYFAVFTMEFMGVEATTTLHMGISVAAILVVFATNTFTKKAGGIVQTIATAAKIIPLAVITVFGFMSNNNPEGVFAMSEAAKTSTESPLLLFGMALVPVMFAFDGWIYVGTISGELKNVKKDLPKAIILGLGSITLIYTLLNIALLKVFPAEQLVEQGMFGVANQLLGPIGAKFVFLGIMVSAFGGLNGFTLVSTRVPYILASEGHFPASEYISKIDEATEQPMRSCGLMFILVMGYLAAMFVTGNADVFGDVPVALFWVFYSLVFMGVIILRKKEPNLERPYKVPLYPVIPILAIIGGLSIGIYATISNPSYMLISIAATLGGLIFYKKSPQAVSA